MKKQLLIALLALTTLAAIGKHVLTVGDPCTTADGRSGYIFAGGIDGGGVCVAGQ